MKTTPAQFVRQVKQEVAKITWPTRAEIVQGTVSVAIMSIVIAAFLFVIDMIFASAIKMFLDKIGG